MVVIGADLNPGALARAWSVALIPVTYSVNSTTIARHENGIVQTVDDLTLVLSPKRGYFGFPAAGIVAVSETMPRQDFARWVRSARKPDKPAVSDYLQRAVTTHKDAHVVIATDLQDLFDPTAARTALEQSGEVPTEARVTSLVKVLTGARGLVFTAQLTEKTSAVLRIEFSVPMADFLADFRRLWPKVLDRSGLHVDEFRTAEVKADGKAVVLTTDLSDTSMRRILSLLAAPGEAVPEEEGTASRPTAKEAASLSASVRYYKAVNSALDDLKASGGAREKNYVRSADYFDLYANKISKLSLTDVDPALVQYGASVTAKLRAMAGSLRGLKVQLEAYDTYKSTVYAPGGGLYLGPRGGIGLGGGGGMSTNVPELSTKQAELVAKLEPERAKTWGVLEADRSAVRKEMLDKYKIDFDQYKR
jgi:hypothetical protein